MNPISEQNPSPAPTIQTELYTDSESLSQSFNEENLFLGIFRMLRKHLWLILACMALGVGAAIMLNITTPKEYKAQANIQITQDTANQFRLEQANAFAGDIDTVKIDTEIEILRSSTLALQTIRSLKLDRNDDFLPAGLHRSWDLNSPFDRQMLVAVFVGHLTAARLGHTNIIQLSMTSTKPQLAADMCNELIRNYTEHNFKDNYAATEEVSRWLQAQLGELKHRLEDSQQRMLDAQKDIGIVGIDQTQSIVLTRLEALNRNVTQAEADRLVLQAKLIALRSSPPAVVDTLSADPILTQLRSRKAQLEDEYATLESKYLPANPRIVNAKSQIEQIDQAIKDEESAVLRRADKEVEAAAQNENALRSTLNAAQQSAFDSNSKVVAYSLSRREYEANRTLYDGLQQRLQEAGIIAGLHSSSIRLVDAADAPVDPSKPRKTFNLMAGFLAGLLFGITLALLLESLDTNIKTISDVEDVLGLPLLGVIPQVDSKQLVPQEFVANATQSSTTGWSQMAEAYRALRTALLLSRAGSPPQVILVSSSKPSEGKTSVTSLESITLALSGARVLLIDADLRRPSVHARFKIPNRIGLSSVLSGKSTIEEALYTLPSVPSLQVLPAGPVAPMPAELLGSSEMQYLLASLRQKYDFILIDTPPVLTVTDAAVLVSLSDGAILVLRYGETGKNAIARTNFTLKRAGAHILGVVINAVDYKSPDYSEYYGRSYRDYYGYRSTDESQDL